MTKQLINFLVWSLGNRPVTGLGHQGGRRIFSGLPKVFKLCPTHFPGGEKYTPFVVMHLGEKSFDLQLVSLLVKLTNQSIINAIRIIALWL